MESMNQGLHDTIHKTVAAMIEDERSLHGRALSAARWWQNCWYSRFQFRSNIAYRVLLVVFDPLRNVCSNSSIFTCVDCCGAWLSVTRPAYGTHSLRQHKPLFERN